MGLFMNNNLVRNYKLGLVTAMLATLVGCEAERLYLQQATDSSIIVKWRNGQNSVNTAVKWGTSVAALNQTTNGTSTDNTNYEAKLTGLQPDSIYYYALGDGAGSEAQSFHTAPQPGALPADGNVRVWLIGDSGTGNNDAKAVANGYYTYNNNVKDADVWLMLGDNAYNEGTDQDYQTAVFLTYPELLKKTALWPTIGNHEMGSFGTSTAQEITGDNAYMNIFTLPKNGEAGGVNSGTEQYYSFDYGNVHFICLDSQVTARNATKRAAMKSWLEDDLNASTADWKIVFFHHPPYSKGSHNSDGASGIDQPMTDMRVEFTPIFDDHGVDLVFSGHSHSYERSYYIGGHTGLSSTFNASQHAEVNAAGQPLNGKGDQAYSQITNNGSDDKVVYTVAGSGGKISGGSLNHPAHVSSQNVLASVVLDITQYKLEAKTLGVNGNVLDSYTIER